jgi:hypothetical protein
VYPTWLVVKEHVPIEQRETPVDDEEASIEVKVIPEKPTSEALTSAK